MSRFLIYTVGLLVSYTALGAGMNGSLPLYPNGRNMNTDMSVPPPGTGAPMVLATADSVPKVDAWYAANAPKGCARTTASGAVKYACPGGSIMIYDKGGTQIAFVPAMAMMFGR